MRLGTDVAQTHNASCSCPVCLGLEAQQRPRYFSGQLLTEAELNSEQAYMRSKLQLHNRYLHGSGIVCGLQVSCSDCAGFVTIEPGYAIDPCGNDIIVSSAQKFNLLKRIQECAALRKRQRRTGCDPMQPPVDPNCQDTTQHYCLTIAYQEQEARPINALRQVSATKTSMNGNGSSCGCSSSQYGASATTRSASTMQSGQQSQTLPNCEPTRIMEQLAALQGEVEKLKTNQTQPPEQPKS